MPFIKNFREISKSDAAIAGGKGASLGEMTQTGIPVPPGFVILAEAFERFLEITDLNVEIDAALDEVDIKEMHTIENASEKIKALILVKEIPLEIRKSISYNFDKLGAKFVAVRSSATAEDSSVAAWAGQLDSFLNTTNENLLDNVKQCWASLFTPRAIFYRFEKNLHKQKISVAVVVQEMVNSEKSGIAFSVHPVTEDYNQIIIEAGFGLGEAIVSGSITPDSYVIDKQGYKILDINVNEQSRGLYRKNQGGNEWKELGEKGNAQVLTEKEIIELSTLIVKIENHYGFPCDIEWARENGKFSIVQSRPITTLKIIETSPKRIFMREHSREYSLFRVETLARAMNQELQKILGITVEEECAVYRGGDLVDIYYEPAALKKLFGAIMKSSRDKSGMLEKIRFFLSTFEEYKKYLYQDIESVEELKRFQDIYAYVWSFFGIIFLIPSVPVDEEIKKSALAARNKTQEYNETPEVIFKKFVESKFPKLKNKSRFVLMEEIWNGEIENEDIFSKIKDRQKGYVFYKNEIFTGDLNDNLEKLGIVLEDKESMISGKAQVTGNEIKGQSASDGKVEGLVKIVSSTKDLAKVKKGDILVAAMTMPKYLPAMKKAAAFVTDEGGLTCHAAIIAREMKKPCVIGTKIATQFLKDGDLVEVDADNGVVRKLN
jgi:phosphoenolpyruvate synthase/pyruvate phosphate dikinase